MDRLVGTRHDVGMREITIDNRIRVRIDDLSPDAVGQLMSDFEHRNPQRAKLEHLGIRGRALHKEPKVIETWRIADGWLTLPRGGLDRLRNVLDDFGFERRIVDARTQGDPSLAGKLPEHRLPDGQVLWDFQRQIVGEATRIENCAIRSPTGSGKTTAALAFAAAVNLPTLVIVWTGGLLDQWVRRAKVELRLADDDIGIIGGGTHRIRPLTIGMQQSLRKCVHTLVDTFGVVIPDELQRFAAGTFFDVIDALPARYRVGFSANEKRKDRKEFLIYDMFGDVAVDVSQASLIGRGIVHDVEIRVVPTEFDAPWYRDLMDRSKDDPATGPSYLVTRDRLLAFDRIAEEMGRDAARCAIATRIVAEAVAAGEQIVLLSHRREHCRTLAADVSALGIECGLMLGGADGEGEYEQARMGIERGSLRCAAGTYQAIGTGIDLPSVGVGVCCLPLANSADGRPFFAQVRGRFCRTSAATGKAGAVLYYLNDPKVYGWKPLRNLRRWNQHVVVLENGSWVDARDVLKRIDKEADDATAK